MTNEPVDNPTSDEIVIDGRLNEADTVKPSRRRANVALWLTGPLSIIVLLILAFAIYLSSAGIDFSWAAGTSGWVAPPGSRLAGHDIGGKSIDDVDSILDRMSEEFSGLSVWLVESPLIPSVVAGDFSFSTVMDEVALSVAPEEFGLSFDIAAMQSEIAALDKTSADLLSVRDRIALWKEPPEIKIRLSLDENIAREYLEGVKSTIDCEPVDAMLDLANYRISPAGDGLNVDIDSILSKVPTIIDALCDLPVELIIDRIQPDITNDDFSGIDLENPLASYTTRFNRWKRNRSFNIEMVASHFEAIVIEPGEVLSFDEITGPREYAQGYKAAPMYRNRRVEMSPAGGSCQVSTTLYNVALLAGLEIVFRLPHSRPCSYVPYGRDATVAWGSVDLKFRNSLKHPIILHQIVDRHDAGTIVVEIFGHPDDRVYVEIGNAYSWIMRTDSMTTYVVDTSLDPGEEVVEDSGVNGLYQRAWRTWFDDKGNELYVEELSRDHVRPVGAYIRHNPASQIDSWREDTTQPDQSETTEPSDPDEPSPDEPPPGIF